MIRESLVIHPAKSGCSVVNVLDIEKYLDGVVNGEFSAKWNSEAVAAQVIAARSYALYQSKQARLNKAFFDVESTTKDQVYLGVEGEETRASQVVSKTRGVVLASALDERGARIRAFPSGDLVPIKAFYHSTCGGKTDSPEDVWGQPQIGVRGGVRCLHCGSSPRFRWDVKLSNLEIDRLFSSFGKGKVRSIEALSRFPSGRVRQVKVGFLDGAGKFSSTVLNGSQFRSILGVERLRSTFFDVSGSATRDWIFQGRGNGHGVGMCQWGAKEMGAEGYNAEQILTHYYPQAYLVKVWK
ncbi:MAG: SpoIID/LytB domain-containing protein [Bdellovibrionales bacterium]|nr:SpoIID/LytB domain-containing protein [Bdellovibrionales bacterium]